MSQLLISESPVLSKLRKNKPRRVLQVLQVSATDKDLLVSPNLMSGNGKKPAKSQKKTEIFQDEILSKENTPVMPTVRRSKRKNAVAKEQVKTTTSKEEIDAKATSNKVSKVTKAKKTSTRKGKKQSSVDLKQSKMDSFIASSSTSNTIFESNLENDGSSVFNDVQFQKSENDMKSLESPSYIPHSDASLQDFSKDSGIVVSPNMLTCDKPPEKYWELLAEERRIALEEALRQNEELYDQLQVLEAENSQLKECVKGAERLAMALGQTLD